MDAESADDEEEWDPEKTESEEQISDDLLYRFNEKVVDAAVPNSR